MDIPASDDTPPFILEKRDLCLIHQLRKNGRLGLTELSRLTNIPISTLHERLKVYAKSGLIRRYTTLLDFYLLGYSIRAFMFFVADKNTKETLRSYLATCPCVNTLTKINHGYDFFVEAVFRTMQEVDAFRERVCQKYGAKHVEIHYVIEEIKEEGFLLTKPD